MSNWKSCSNIDVPKFPEGILTRKIRYIGRSYYGKGRPRKEDYEYKSVLDMMFEIDRIFNLKVSNL